jgi:Tol biopolymer transport system component
VVAGRAADRLRGRQAGGGAGRRLRGADGCAARDAFADVVDWFPNGSLAIDIAVSDTVKTGIYRVNVDGTGLRFLLTGNDPSVSPDGTKLLFVRVKTGTPGTPHVWVARSDGSNARRLTKGKSFEGGPSWSPDGKWIAYERTLGAGSFNPRTRIVVAHSNGTGAYVAVIATKRYNPFTPTWRAAVTLPKAARASC